MPYSVHLNDIASFDFPGFNPAAYQQQLTDEFDQLYTEGANRRRMMVIGLHERISGHASRVRVLDRIFTRLRYHEDVRWARKDQIAQWVLDHPGTAVWATAVPPRSAACRAGAPEARIWHLPRMPPQGRKATWKALWSTPPNSCAISLICETALTAAPSPGRTKNASLRRP